MELEFKCTAFILVQYKYKIGSNTGRYYLANIYMCNNVEKKKAKNNGRKTELFDHGIIQELISPLSSRWRHAELVFQVDIKVVEEEKQPGPPANFKGCKQSCAATSGTDMKRVVFTSQQSTFISTNHESQWKRYGTKQTYVCQQIDMLLEC